MTDSFLLFQVRSLVYEAAVICKKDFSVRCKGGNSDYVTTADTSIESFLKKKLPALIDGSRMMGEEGDTAEDLTGYLWVVDPIDGTMNFIRGLNLSVISAGLLKDGFPVLGVVYNPFTDECFYGGKGLGVFCNGEPVSVSDRDYSHSLYCTAFSLYRKEYADICFRSLERIYPDIDDMRRLGSAALEIAYLAAGKADLFFEIRIFPWDCAAALALLSEAGGEYEVRGYDKEIPCDRAFTLLAANSRESLGRIRKVIYEEMGDLMINE